MSSAELRYPAREMCVVMLTGLGDVVNTLPAVNAIRDFAPSLRVTWVAEPMPAEVLRPHPSVDEVVVFRKRDGWRGVARLGRELGRRRFDLTLNFNRYFKSVWPTILSRAPHRLGLDRTRASDGIWLAANHHVGPRPWAHPAEMALEFLDHLGVPRPPRPEYRLQITAGERREQRDYFARFGGRPVAAIIPATSMRKRDWFADRYAQVASSLERDFGFRTVLVGGPGEREQSIAREITSGAAVAPEWALGDGVRRVMWMLDACDLVISPDTGPLHIARALEVPVVGLYGQTHPWRGGPFRAYEDLWVNEYWDPGETPDYSDRTPRRDRMERITTESVLERVRHAVEHYGAGRVPRATTRPA
ncbi:MAG TPA: glycosyltransferase family 9 protein [Longimicrobium sp.]|jgi:heptosyltransferase I